MEAIASGCIYSHFKNFLGLNLQWKFSEGDRARDEMWPPAAEYKYIAVLKQNFMLSEFLCVFNQKFVLVNNFWLKTVRL